MTGTTFTSRQYWQKNNSEDGNSLSESEQLQDACWNGLLKEMLPEICRDDQKLYLWQIKENRSCIDIQLSEYPEEPDPFFSIDPNTILQVQTNN